MQYSNLDQCVDLLKTPVDRLSPGHPQESALLKSEENIAEFFVEPFSDELENNLVNNTTPDQKADIIKLYISRLMKSKNHIPLKEIEPDLPVTVAEGAKNDNPPVTIRIGNMLILDNSYNPGNDLKFRKGCNILYHLLFDELQKYCINYDVPFIRLCKGLGFGLDTINIEYSIKHGPGEMSLLFDDTEENKSHPDLEPISCPDFEDQLAEIKISENKFWKGVPMTIVIDHFKVLTTKKSSNGAAFLTQDQFIAFLKKGFLNDTTFQKLHINSSRGEKGLIIKRFYQFYDLSVSDFGSAQPQEKFLNLFYNCFDNWNLYTIKEFFKRNKVIKQWDTL